MLPDFFCLVVMESIKNQNDVVWDTAEYML